ncbi:MAG: OsmC family peroxiredoxin [Flavobacteriales bacterium]|jgi:putative redox protein|nr:MAG: OsmC family peroxiredoxin [Flavobacteriales bacterium]
MQHKVEAQWMGRMKFNALVNGHTLVMDAPPHVGGDDEGPIPKPFMLTALAGCTGMDVIALLRKEGIALGSFGVDVTGEISKTKPIVYTSAHLLYDAQGDPAHREATLAVVQRSQHELCGVSAMMKKAMPVTWTVRYNGEVVFDNSTPA